MSDAKAFGFGQFIPGYDFLQQLTQASQGSSLPPFSSWVAPTVSVEEIDKRIEELKAVQFWLEQNNRALSATVQALQVQKMTLSTLKGMNVNLTDFAQAFGSASAPMTGSGAGSTSAGAQANVSNWPMDATTKGAAPAQAAQAETAPQAQEQAQQEATAQAAADHASATASAAMQWWNALTQQFQTIATQALQDPAQLPAMAQAASMASDFTKAAVKATSDLMQQAVSQANAPVQAVQSAAATARAPAKKASATAKKAAPPQAESSAGPATATATASTPRTSKASSPRTAAKKATTTSKTGGTPA